MGERRFLLKETTEFGIYPLHDEITESVLKRRFRVAVDRWRDDWPWEMVCNILLHGEGEKGPVPVKNDTDATSQVPNVGINYPSQTVGYVKAVHNKPSPTPTRAEWKAWAKSVAVGIIVSYIPQFTEELLISMPIVPKVDEED